MAVFNSEKVDGAKSTDQYEHREEGHNDRSARLACFWTNSTTLTAGWPRIQTLSRDGAGAVEERCWVLRTNVRSSKRRGSGRRTALAAEVCFGNQFRSTVLAIRSHTNLGSSCRRLSLRLTCCRVKQFC